MTTTPNACRGCGTLPASGAAGWFVLDDGRRYCPACRPAVERLADLGLDITADFDPEAPRGTGRHLHLDDYPRTLALLAELLGGRGDRDALGYEPTEHGAYVDWDHLTTTAALSSTERAAAQIARGCAGLERAGGARPDLAAALVVAVTVTSGTVPAR